MCFSAVGEDNFPNQPGCATCKRKDYTANEVHATYRKEINFFWCHCLFKFVSSFLLQASRIQIKKVFNLNRFFFCP